MDNVIDDLPTCPLCHTQDECDCYADYDDADYDDVDWDMLFNDTSSDNNDDNDDDKFIYHQHYECLINDII